MSFESCDHRFFQTNPVCGYTQTPECPLCERDQLRAEVERLTGLRDQSYQVISDKTLEALTSDLKAANLQIEEMRKACSCCQLKGGCEVFGCRCLGLIK